METTVAFAPKISSGVDVIDEAWGGLYRGGSYLVYGRAATGRSLLTMTFAKTGAEIGERCVFISPDRPKDLMIQAASLNFNLRDAHESGLVRLLRIPPMLNLDEAGDESILKALGDLVSIVRQNMPDRLVINDFLPFVQFRSFERFCAAFVEMLEQIDSLDTTLALVMAEPANQQSRRVIDFMRSQMTGAVHIELAEANANSTRRRLTLLPNIGHITSHVVEFWDLQEVVVDPDLHASASPRMLPGRAGRHPSSPPDAGRPRYRLALDDASGESGEQRIPESPSPSQPEGASDSYRHSVEGALPSDEPTLAEKSVPSTSSEQDEVHDSADPTRRQRRKRGEQVSARGFIRPIPLGRTREHPAPHQDETSEPMPSSPAMARERPYSREFEHTREPAQSSFSSGTTDIRHAAPLPYRDEPVYRSEPAEHAEAADVAVPSAHEDVIDGGPPAESQEPTTIHYPEETVAAPSSVSASARTMPLPSTRVSHSDRDAFRSRLQQHFLRRDVNDTPFMLIAMRMDRSEEHAARPFDFEFILDLVSELLRGEDDMVVELERERLIVLLAESRHDDARNFFVRLKNRLREEAPKQADHLLHSVSAFYLSDGRPFKNAEEFLTYALDED